MRIYVASSWRNEAQPTVVARLKQAGHEVYDFRNPPDRTGFDWRDIDPNWENWSTAQYKEALTTEFAKAGFASDMNALMEADVTVLVGPSGRSAHLELGVAVGQEQITCVLLTRPQEAELMYKMCDLITDDVEEIVAFLAREVEALGQVILVPIKEDKQTVDLNEREHAALAAIQHVLRQTQRDPDFREVAHRHSQSWDLLTRAEALLLGHELDSVQKRRVLSLVPQGMKSRREMAIAGANAAIRHLAAQDYSRVLSELEWLSELEDKGHAE